MMRALRELDVRRLVIATLFVPLLMFSFFSVHTMPRFSTEGLVLVICTGVGIEAIPAGGEEDPTGRPGQSPCDWSMQIHAAALPGAGLAYGPVPLGRGQAVAFEQIILRTGRINAGRHARAPPVSV